MSNNSPSFGPLKLSDNTGDSWLQRIGGAANLSDDGGATFVPLGARTGVIRAGSSFAKYQTALAQANALGGQTIEFGKGTYDVTAQSLLNAHAVRLVGNGEGSTIINLNDSGGLSGADAFVVNSVLSARFEGMTFTANGTPRTSGAMIKVLGVNNITANPAQRVNQYTIADVDAEDMFNGLVVNDGPSNQGAWGGITKDCHWLRFGAGGTYIDVNTPHGGQQKVRDVQFYGSTGLADAQRALAGVRYRAGADLELTDVSSVYMQTGYLCNPDGQLANVGILNGCDWDNNTRASISFTPVNGGQCIGHRIMDGWGFTVLGLGYPCIDINPAAGCNADNNAIRGGSYWGNFIGARIRGPAWNVLIDGCNFSADTTGILATNNAFGFTLSNNVIGTVTSSFPLVGIQIDAGCDHYGYGGNMLFQCTTPIIDTPGALANRRINWGNITA